MISKRLYLWVLGLFGVLASVPASAQGLGDMPNLYLNVPEGITVGAINTREVVGSIRYNVGGGLDVYGPTGWDYLDPSISDITEVQVSGGLLTIVSGEGPIPVVGLTAASVNSAETDPNAVLLTTAQTIAGSKTFNSPIIGSGANLTSLNASELDSGTIPLARIVDLTSNEVATATDTAYRNVAETDPNAVLLTGAQTVAGAKTFTDSITTSNGTYWATLGDFGGLAQQLYFYGGSGKNLSLQSGFFGNIITANDSGGEGLQMRGDFIPYPAEGHTIGTATYTWDAVYSDNFIGGGANLTSLNGANLQAGTVDAAALAIGLTQTNPFVIIQSGTNVVFDVNNGPFQTIDVNTNIFASYISLDGPNSNRLMDIHVEFTGSMTNVLQNFNINGDNITLGDGVVEKNPEEILFKIRNNSAEEMQERDDV